MWRMISEFLLIIVRVLLQYWMMYFLYILGPAFLLCGCLLLTLESSDPWWEGEYSDISGQ